MFPKCEWENMLNYVSSTDTATEMQKWEGKRPVICLYLVQKSKGTSAGALHTTHQSVNCHLLLYVPSFQIIYSLIFHNKRVLIARKYIVFIKRAVLGAPGWLSGLKPLPSAQVMISEFWDQAPNQALYSAGSMLPPLSLSLCLLVISLSAK